MNDRLVFLREWAAAPLQMASVTPSSKSLARLMTAGLGPESGPVIELGPGTGVFTRAMLERGLAEEDLALIELNRPLAEQLERRYPKAQVHCMSAGDLANKNVFESGAQTIVSGLGILSMPDPLVEQILTGILHHLRPGGAYIQFTYGPTCPLSRATREKFGITSERVGGTVRNFPPASVYRMTRTGDAELKSA